LYKLFSYKLAGDVANLLSNLNGSFFYCMQPFLYHNITRDVDDARLQHAVRIYYYLWYSTFIHPSILCTDAFLYVLWF
jgi:hypothetical protein